MTAIKLLEKIKGQTRMNISILGFCAAATAFFPRSASAHIVVTDTHGFLHGFSHPASGIDHILAMIAVGLFAAHLGGRALWLVPLTFVSVMALAGIAAAAGVTVPFVQVGIGMSVAALGLAIACRLNVPTSVAMSLVAFFAVFHGHAHGTEMPESISVLSYGFGFVFATALLHAIGAGIGIAIANTSCHYSGWIVRISGAAMAIDGLVLLASR